MAQTLQSPGLPEWPMSSAYRRALFEQGRGCASLPIPTSYREALYPPEGWATLVAHL